MRRTCTTIGVLMAICLCGSAQANGTPWPESGASLVPAIPGAANFRTATEQCEERLSLLKRRNPEIFAKQVRRQHTTDFCSKLSTARQTSVPKAHGTKAVLHGVRLLGTPYRIGGDDLSEGTDCSGFVREVYRRSTGIDLPRTASEQGSAGMQIAAEMLAEGDLVFFSRRTDRRIDHVGIHLGDAFFIHAPRPGGAVRIDSLEEPHWKRLYVTARRVDPREKPRTGGIDPAR